jgi:hypothetical protein
MTVLEALSKIVDSRKRAQTIMDELRARGFSIVPCLTDAKARETPEMRDRAPSGEFIETGYDVPEVHALPDYPEPLRPDAYPKKRPHSVGILRQETAADRLAR